MLKSINLSLSTACGCDCIYCPANRGKRIEQKFMSLEVVKKIIDEISSKDFQEKHRVKRIEVGENGDAFLNEDLIKILRYIKFKLPDVMIEISTNFQHFTKEKAQIILDEKLIDVFCCNVDGSDEENYYNTKRIDFQIVKKNILDFLETRQKSKNKPSLCICILTLNSYIRTIHKNFGFYPLKLKDYRLKNVPDDSSIIKKQWKKLLDSKIDRIITYFYLFAWAERDQIICGRINYKKYSCPNLQRIKEEAFIAPDGTWYACCYDSNFELVLGNVVEHNIDNIYSSKNRLAFIEKLEKKEFNEAGGPCRTVNCCQYICGNTIRKIQHIYGSTTIKILKRLKKVASNNILGKKLSKLLD